MNEFVQATSTEKGCVYYGWVRAGDKLICREAYINVS
jgi:quinol monooxygenase YgiN